jgi:hypothetical protein
VPDLQCMLFCSTLRFVARLQALLQRVTASAEPLTVRPVDGWCPPLTGHLTMQHQMQGLCVLAWRGKSRRPNEAVALDDHECSDGTLIEVDY